VDGTYTVAGVTIAAISNNLSSQGLNVSGTLAVTGNITINAPTTTGTFGVYVS
jgi:hypothetical protein